MIECTKCRQGHFIENTERNRYICVVCGFEILTHNDLTIFHPEDSVTQDNIEPCILDDLVSFEDKHFWIKARRNIIGDIFKKFVNYTDKIIEIDAGTGNFAAYLSKIGYKDISVGEIHLRGLEYAKRYGIKKLYQFDLTKTPFSEYFDIVGMFDVLEHIDDDDLAVKSIYKMLKHGGKVIITVPAHKWLWSKQDAIAYHRRRYCIEQLKKMFQENNFKIIKINTFFVSMLPFLFIRKLINKDTGVIKENDFKNRFKVNPILNYILSKILEIENIFLSNVPLKCGTSIILIAERL
ncbi:MAG: class I SAM-dependent methyltransferase [Candidatus Omnitrophica bacterium]|jgi:SAM-dependent methyltransferase|nr:class I SAM-dependent methyltransferase [Candidatus Omnitrophota bacterium]